MKHYIDQSLFYIMYWQMRSTFSFYPLLSMVVQRVDK